MKQLSKIMLAAVASVCLAAPAFAWDFSASGSAAARFNSTSTTAATGANAVASGGVSDEGGGITLKSGHTDGAKSANLSYSVDWADDGLDETLSVSGSSKVGDWTASAGTSFNLDRYGCTDNSTTNARCGQQTGEDTTAITVTDGTMTIVLGDAAHLSSQNMSSNGAAAGAVSFDSADDDASVGAFVGGFQGVSLGYKISDAMSATVAYQKSSDYSDMLGAGENFDGEGATYGTTGTGLGFSGTFGPATVGLTIASAATADVGSPTANPASNSTAASTTGLGVKLDLGDIKPFLSYGSYKADGSVSLNGVSYSGNEIGTKYMLGTDSIVFYIGSYEEITTTAGTAGNALTKSGMELGYNTTVGPASLAIGYGSQTHAQTDGATDGYVKTDIEVALGFSF
jgi:hypothetical protein